MEDEKKKGNKGNSLENIESKYILQLIFSNLLENILLPLVKYNKNIQEKLDKGINDYKNYKKVIIEILPINKTDKTTFINYKKGKQYYHIYFNDEKEEKHRNYFNKDENITKIKIIIDEQIKFLKSYSTIVFGLKR